MIGGIAARDAVVGVLVLAVVLVAATVAARARARKTLAGVWVGDGDWLAAAGLESAQLFLARATPRGGKKSSADTGPGGWRGYLVMVGTDGGLVANSAVTIDIGSCAGSLLVSSFSSHGVSAPVILRADAGAGAEPGAAPAMPPLPSGLRATLTPDGVLTVFDKRRLFARLMRDPAASGDALAAFRTA